MKNKIFILIAGTTLLASCTSIKKHESEEKHASSNKTEVHHKVSNEEIAKQRHLLSINTNQKGFGPQAPRDIDLDNGVNQRAFNEAPAASEMNLCNIHFHKNAEHKGGEFTQYAGNGDGKGYQSGYKYSGHLTAVELAPVNKAICSSEHSTLYSGDTIEVHYVYSTAQVKPGPTLGACLSESIKNPQLRVEAQVFVLVNDKKALDFGKLTQVDRKNDFYQASNIPQNTGSPISYDGSTTGPGYNEKGSPFQVTWSVRPKVAKVNIETVGNWCKGNIFEEDHGHGVRNIVKNPKLLSKIIH